ncbi:MAG: hypothetical protein A2X35_00590 [Elusimicrobia bacterium GWA2_61_42]|nr:MAG: hypothetical protein A2X35_00590 [Elusimicrobia bacterium GWA2_61_42]OGR77187.1 MAG: hypothetical protein A2X38_12715 [Elusimicrobia bacterium GWC2_61_25]
MPEDWVETALLSALKEGVPHPVFPMGLPVLLIRRGAELFALENRCAHMGCPLAAGKLDGHILQCPCHDWRFDIRDGRFQDAPELGVKTYSSRIENGKVLVRIS